MSLLRRCCCVADCDSPCLGVAQGTATITQDAACSAGGDNACKVADPGPSSVFEYVGSALVAGWCQWVWRNTDSLHRWQYLGLRLRGSTWIAWMAYNSGGDYVVVTGEYEVAGVSCGAGNQISGEFDLYGAAWRQPLVPPAYIDHDCRACTYHVVIPSP